MFNSGRNHSAAGRQINRDFIITLLRMIFCFWNGLCPVQTRHKALLTRVKFVAKTFTRLIVASYKERGKYLCVCARACGTFEKINTISKFRRIRWWISIENLMDLVDFFGFDVEICNSDQTHISRIWCIVFLSRFPNWLKSNAFFFKTLS